MKTYKPMDQEFKARWIKELREGGHKQTRGLLKNKRTGSMCCLGVALNLIDPEGWSSETCRRTTRGTRVTIGVVWKSSHAIPDGFSLPYSISEKLGLDDGQGEALANLNDNSRKSFSQIADWIEANL